MPELKAVEIFGEGVWNGNTITSKTLDDLVEAFKATKDFVTPVLKLGHNDEQELLKKDGLPAAGWVSNIYVKGRKLLADFKEIPQKIFELIQKKAYRKVSVEIFCGYTFDGKTYPNLLGAVALLGADMPAVMTLSDILDRYKIEAKNFTNDVKSNIINVSTFTKNLEEDDMADTQDSSKIEELETKIETFSSQLDKVNKEKEDLEKKFNTYKEDSDKKIVALEAQKTQAEIDKFALDLKTKELVSPSMEPFVKALLSVDKKDFSVAEKKLSTAEVIEKILSLAKEVYGINKKETSEDSEDSKKDGLKEKQKEIDEYMNKHKCNYSTAYRAVMKQAA